MALWACGGMILREVQYLNIVDLCYTLMSNLTERSLKGQNFKQLEGLARRYR